VAGPLGAAGDHGQQPVLRQGEARAGLTGAGSFEEPGDAGEGQHVTVHDPEG